MLKTTPQDLIQAEKIEWQSEELFSTRPNIASAFSRKTIKGKRAKQTHTLVRKQARLVIRSLGYRPKERRLYYDLG